MTNKNYQKGIRKERAIKKRLEREGKICLRTAGSHGFADLICIDKENFTIQFIQCKAGHFPESEQKKLLEEHKFYNDGHVFETSFIVM